MNGTSSILSDGTAERSAASQQQFSRTRIGVLVKRFPKLSETFILGEIRALIDTGLDIRIISQYAPNEAMQQPGSEAVLDRVCYLDDLKNWQALRVWSNALLRRPLSALRMLRDCGLRVEDLIHTAALSHACAALELSHLHVHYLSDPAELALRVSAMHDISFSISAHAKDIYLSDPAAIRRRIDRAAFVVTCTSQNGTYLTEIAKKSAHKIHVIYHGIDCLYFRPCSHARQCRPTTPLRILATGRFKQKKGFDVLIDACELLLREGHLLTCNIVGYGDEEASLQRRIDQYEIGEQVKLRPPITHARMVDELQQADLFVLPCRQCADGDRDGIPNALLEAMACGVPVLTTRVSGIPEVVEHGSTGMLVEPDDASALANQITRISGDVNLQQLLARNARRVVIEKFNWQFSTRTLLSLLEDTLIVGRKEPATQAPANQVLGIASTPPVSVSHPRIAYVLKGFPRLSESFIANEVRQLSAHGLDLGLFSIKHGDSMVKTDDLPPVNYAPAVTPLTDVKLMVWLTENLPSFMADQRFWMKRHPLRYFSTLVFAVGLALRYRSSGDESEKGSTKGSLKKSHIKEFLLATYIGHRLIEQGGYQHIHAHFCHDATTVAWMVSRLCKLPFSFTAHAKDIYQRRLNPRDFLQRKLDAATFTVTCTEANVEALRVLTTDPHKVHGIYHGLDTRLFLPGGDGRSATESEQYPPLILSIGRHVEKKGFVYLIKASRILRDRGVDHRVHVVGERADQSEIMVRMINEYELQDTIQLLPPLPQSALVECYHKSRVFVLPCVILRDGDRDGIPNVMAEAMACALPVVVTGISGIPEMVDDQETGLIVAQRDSVALADAIERVLVDDVLAARLGTAARRRVESCFDADVTHVVLKDLFYSQVCQQELTAA